MNFLIYKITNLIDNSIYIGKHKTKDKNDSYFGSGVLLKCAIEKYGIENFKKEIIFECKSEDEMNELESNIVDEVFVSRLDTYNVALGGKGGYEYINSNYLNGNSVNRSKEHMSKMGKCSMKKFWTKYENDENFKKEMDSKTLNNFSLYVKLHGNPFKGKKHTNETKIKMSKSHKGKCVGDKNGSYGTIWITDDNFDRKINRNESIPDGWRRGRKK